MTEKKYLIDIPMCVYNHGKYVEKAIEGVLNQKTNFGFRLIIGEDCSTDNSRELVKKYLPGNEDKLKVFFHERNIGAHANSKILFDACTSKYIALCDGDDYWVDENKLQMQVDFLENNPDFAICCHHIYLLSGKKIVLHPFYTGTKEQTYTIEDLAKGNFISTPSVVYRNGLVKKTPDWINETPIGDYVYYMLNAQFGKIKYFPLPMAVYREHGTGTWGSLSQHKQHENMLKVLEKLIIELKSLPEVVHNLQYQMALEKSNLAEFSLAENNKAGYLEILKEAFAISPAFMDDWLIQSGMRYTDLKRSPEYKIGWALRHPLFMVKKYAPFLTPGRK